jgi:hypothetical protein
MSIVVACFTKRNQKEGAAREREREREREKGEIHAIVSSLVAAFLAIAFSFSSASCFLTV